MKKWMKPYLLFSKKERIGLLVVLLVLGCFLYLPVFFRAIQPPLVKADTAWMIPMEQASQLVPRQHESKWPRQAYGQIETVTQLDSSIDQQPQNPIAYFYFDPNTASAKQFIALGLSEKNAQTIIRYRSKGGQFRQPTDIHKIWGINPTKAAALVPYIQIKGSSDRAFGYKRENNQGGSDHRSFGSQKQIGFIKINTANVSDWEALPGIGPVLARRIIQQREQLGGFTELLEIRQTYGISDSLFLVIQPFLLVDAIGKPSINTASVATLKKVGVSAAIAAAIVQYRIQYGLFTRLEDLKKIVFIQEQQYQALLELVKL